MFHWKIIISGIVIAASASLLRAQDHTVTPIDGPTVKADTLTSRPQPFSQMAYPLSPMVRMPIMYSPAPLFESPEEMAARRNWLIYNNIMTSVDQSLYWQRPPHYSRGEKMAYFALGLFLSNPYGFKDGYTPLMNHSFPFIYAKIPGMSPYYSPYSPEYFPQAVRTEYDFATGTYKQVLVDWNEFQLKMPKQSQIYYNAPPPKIMLTPGDLIMNNTP